MGIVLTFNQFLQAGGLAPQSVRLLRHRDSKSRIHRALYDAAMKGDPKFAQYQERQGTPQVIEHFRNATYLAGFVAEPMTQATVFVGVWERLDERAERKDNPFEPDPPTSRAIEFNTRRMEAFDDYSGRLVIEWGDGTRVRVQRADNQDKRIIEVRQSKRDPDFPGLLKFLMPLDFGGALRRIHSRRDPEPAAHVATGRERAGSGATRAGRSLLKALLYESLSGGHDDVLGLGSEIAFEQGLQRLRSDVLVDFENRAHHLRQRLQSMRGPDHLADDVDPAAEDLEEVRACPRVLEAHRDQLGEGGSHRTVAQLIVGDLREIEEQVAEPDQVRLQGGPQAGGHVEQGVERPRLGPR